MKDWSCNSNVYISASMTFIFGALVWDITFQLESPNKYKYRIQRSSKQQYFFLDHSQGAGSELGVNNGFQSSGNNLEMSPLITQAKDSVITLHYVRYLFSFYKKKEIMIFSKQKSNFHFRLVFK